MCAHWLGKIFYYKYNKQVTVHFGSMYVPLYQSNKRKSELRREPTSDKFVYIATLSINFKMWLHLHVEIAIGEWLD